MTMCGLPGAREERRASSGHAQRPRAGRAKYRSTANTVMPIEPNGTRPISTLCPDRLFAEQRTHTDTDREQRQRSG